MRLLGSDEWQSLGDVLRRGLDTAARRIRQRAPLLLAVVIGGGAAGFIGGLSPWLVVLGAGLALLLAVLVALERDNDFLQGRALAQRTEDLRQLLELGDRAELETTGAEIIAGAASPEFRTVTIDKGTNDRLDADMAVLSPSGVVGRVILPSRRASKVQLLVDGNAAAGAIIERTRAQGVVFGDGTDELRMDYVPGTTEVKPGDLVVTSGIDGIYPKGFVIGTVESAERGPGTYHEIRVRPAVDFARLEEVLVVLTPPPGRETTEPKDQP